VTGLTKPAFAAVALTLLCAASGLLAQDSGTEDQSRPSDEQSAPAQRVRVSQEVSRGLLIRRVQPKYPKKARKEGIQGTVVLHAIISKEGDITSLELVSGDPILASAAIEAVKQWKYKPYLIEGIPVAVDTEIKVNFTLSRN